MKCLQDEYSVDKCRIDNAATEKENIEGLGQQIRLLKEKEESIDKQIKLLEVESHNIYREWNRLDDELYEKVKLYYGKQEELK
jgi:archaellum component FlaC